MLMDAQKQSAHGGDVYERKIFLDLSVSLNPLGLPEGLRRMFDGEGAREMLLAAQRYPDPFCRRLQRELAAALERQECPCPPEHLLFGNGASELILAAVRAVAPKTALLLLPSFSGYETALARVGAMARTFALQAEEGFCVTRQLLDCLDGVDLLILANPNNPTGRLIERGLLKDLLDACKKRELPVLLDECFIMLSDDSTRSAAALYQQYPNLMLLRAFTKTFATPGLRLGYLLCADPLLREKIASQLPEWNVSSVAQLAGCLALKGGAESGGIDWETLKDHIKTERTFVAEGLEALGIGAFPSDCNFMLLQSDLPLASALEKRGILIRDCANFSGLGSGFYRIGLQKREEHRLFLRETEKIVREDWRGRL